MPEATASPLPEWESFYVILGSSAAVLTGLVFVVITLMDDRPRRSSETFGMTIDAFSTSTIVHLCAVLFVSALLSAPWDELSHVCLVLIIAGAGGIVYALITVRRLRRQGTYDPEFEDWLWYALTPLAAYSALIIAALLLPNYPNRAMFGVGAVALVLLFLGLRNAWDSVTYTAMMRLQRRSEDDS